MKKLIALLFVIALSFPSCGDPQYLENQILSGEGGDFAYYMACEFVKERLTSPGSAKFPGYYERGVDVTYLQNSLYAVRGFVDSQNGFGAMIRTQYSCQMQYLGNDRWSFTNFRVQS